jgi:hypothetical protein
MYFPIDTLANIENQESIQEFNPVYLKDKKTVDYVKNFEEMADPDNYLFLVLDPRD